MIEQGDRGMGEKQTRVPLKETKKFVLNILSLAIMVIQDFASDSCITSPLVDSLANNKIRGYSYSVLAPLVLMSCL